MEETHIAIFNGKAIRRTRFAERWWFVIEDIISVLTDSVNPKDYISKMKQRDEPLSEGWGQIVRTLPIITSGGKQEMNCADTEGIFRIIQSIPSKKAEPFKRWLARVGYERVQEIENPELAQERMKELYEKKGYSKDWIDKRLRGIGHALMTRAEEEYDDCISVDLWTHRTAKAFEFYKNLGYKELKEGVTLIKNLK
jgi:prophage antirepressor-like protein